MERMDVPTVDLAGEATAAAATAESALPSRYVLLERLGEGGMGIVYTAYDRQLDRKIAVKLLRKEESAGARARLTREALALAKLHHPNVVTLFDAGSAGDRPYLAMELVEGTSLRAWLAETPRSWREIVRAFVAAGRGLAAAHGRGLVHRDFKPDNVLVGRDGAVRVADFGLAYRVAEESPADLEASPADPATDLTRTGAIVGTPRYMSPEQIAGGAADARGDQFSFCVALYEALYRQEPFAGADLAELGANAAAGKLVEPPRGAHVPSRLAAILRRGLAGKPADRWPTMDALLERLVHDPAVARRRTLALAGTALGAGALVLVALRAASPAEVCTGARMKLAGIWDDAVAAKVKTAFLATGRPHAAETFRRAAGLLDDYAAGFVAMHTETCAATARRREQSEAVLDLRMRCLDRLALGARALTEALAAATPEIVDGALPAIARLGDVSACADVERLAGAPPLPADAATRAQIAAAETQIARADALLGLGQRRVALEAATAAETTARAAGYPPVFARAVFELGAARAALRDKVADATLREAIDRAAAALDDELGARAWYSLVDLLDNTDRAAEAETLSFANDAAVTRAGGNPIARGYARLAHAQALLSLGKYDEARRVGGEAVALFEAHPKPGDPGQRTAANFMGRLEGRMGNDQAAFESYRRSLALTEAQAGPEHPQVAVALANIAGRYADQGEPEKAWPLLERALVIYEKTYGVDSPEIADALHNLGVADRMADRFDEAERAYRRALAIIEKVNGPESSEAASTLGALGATLDEAGRFAESHELLVRALAIVEKTLGTRRLEAASDSLALGILALDEKDFAEAARRTAHAREVDAAVEPGEWQEGYAWTYHGAALCEGGQRDEGHRDLERGVAMFRASKEPDKVDLVTALSRLVECDVARGRSGDGAALDAALGLPGPPLRARIEARAKFALARSLWIAGADRPRARALAAEARALLQKAPRGVEPLLAETEAWIAGHKG